MSEGEENQKSHVRKTHVRRQELIFSELWRCWQFLEAIRTLPIQP